MKRRRRNIHNILDDKLLRAQRAMERELESITLADVMEDLKKALAREPDAPLSV